MLSSYIHLIQNDIKPGVKLAHSTHKWCQSSRKFLMTTSVRTGSIFEQSFTASDIFGYSLEQIAHKPHQLQLRNKSEFL